jgi:hypothetical protein
MRPTRNPLLPVLIGFLVVGFFDVRFYVVEHHFIALGSAIVGAITTFIILFFIASRFAWLAAVITVLIVVVTLFLTYQLGYMGFPLTPFLAIFDLVLFGFFLAYIWRRKEPYFRYVASKEAQSSAAK